jgi:hypothetical protein
MRRYATSAIFGVSLLMFIGIAPHDARAQESRGTIVGTVTDSSGGVVPGAKVEVVNSATNVDVPTVTNESGSFRVPFLIPGQYRITVGKPGFKTYVHPEVEVRVAEMVEVKTALQVGETTETVQVNASAEVLQTTEASQSSTITRAQLDEIPIQGGSVMELLGYAPGMAKTGELRTPYPAWNQGLGMFSSNGAGEAHNDITLDGVANSSVGVPGQSGMANSFSRPAISLSSYGVEEMKIQTNVYDATQGHTSGAVFNMVSRSGTNELHGEVHYQFYPSSLAAENPFNRSYDYYDTAAQKRYGFSLGGPVILPKLYHGRNRTFWFFTMEKHPLETPTPSITTVPTDAERKGDFSALLAVGPQYQIYDPLSIASHSDLSRTAFPGNIIPSSRLDPVAQNILKYYKSANTTSGVSADGQGNYTWTDPQVDRYDTYSTRIDHSLSDKHRLMGRFSWDNWYESGGDVFGNGTTAVDGFQYRRSYVFALDDVYVFSPSVVLDVKVGVTRQPYTNGPPSASFDYSALGFSSQMIGLIAGGKSIFPSINFSGPVQGIGAGGGYYNNNTNETLNGTLSWQRGKHSLRFGAEGRMWTQSYMNTYNNTSPSISFSSAYTSGPNVTSNSAPMGQDMAAFVLGIPSSASMGISSPFTARYDWAALFVQDDWKVTSKLTLNVGMRWEVELPTTERYNRMEIGFNPSATPSFAGAAQNAYAAAGYAANASSIAAAANLNDPAATGALQSVLAAFPSSYTPHGGYVYASSSDRGRWDTDWKQFLPRFGLAYKLDDKTVIRSGFGIFYDSLGIGRNSLPPQDGFSRATSIPSSLNEGATFQNSLANPFPTGLLQPVGSSLGADLGAGNGLNVGYLGATEPYSMHWSLGVQRELPGKVLLDVSYVGSKSVHLPSYIGSCNYGVPCTNLNNIPRQYLSTSPTYDQTNLAMLSALVPNPYAGLSQLPNLNGPTTSVAQLLQPYSQFGGILGTITNGSAWYHSLQTHVERRFSRGFTISGSLTWDSSMEATDYLNATDPKPVKEIAYDPGLVFNAMTVYEIPFGKGRRFGNSWRGPIEYILGGWQVSGTFRTQRGYPAALTDLLLAPGQTLKDLNGQRDPNNFFNVAALNTDTSVQPGWDHLRTLPEEVSYVRGPGFWLTDGAVSKKVTIRERVKGEFRFESYNAANHTNIWPYMVISSANTYGAQYNLRYNGLPRTFEFSLRSTF